MNFIFKNPTFSFELLRTLGYAPYGGSDISEVLSTGYQIKEGDFESWYTEWHRLADKVFLRARDFEKDGERLSASQNYFKASNYYRTAEFFLHGNLKDERILGSWSKSRDAFRKALSLSNKNFEIVSIPYENTGMPAYFYRVDEKARPTLIIHGGFDSTGEELYFQVVVDALARGYNCLTFEGPGQGGMIREKKIPFRPDWENVVGKVIDYLETREDVLHGKLVLMGMSFGGLLAPRAAAFDHRLAACIADDGLFSFRFEDAFKAHSDGNLDYVAIEKILTNLMKERVNVRWAIENGLFTFGAKSIEELFKKTRAYTLENVVEKIQCPVLVCAAENDLFFKGQPELLFKRLLSSKTLMKFGKAENAEEHCHMGALTYFNQKIFAWLNSVLHC